MTGEAWLLKYGDHDKFVAWPYILQTVDSANSLSNPFRDATSVYGFSGPIAHNCIEDPEFLSEASNSFLEVWREQRVVSVFTRFHPIFGNHRWFGPERGGIEGRTERTGATVFIDLSQSPDEIWNGYKRQLRQAIRHVERGQEFTAVHDPHWEHLDEFIAIYHATMKRNNAAPFLFFPRSYFVAFKEALGPHGSLYLSFREGAVVAGFLLIEYGGIATVFLAGSDESSSRGAPNKFLFHKVQCFARARENRFLHFGGGRGGRDDDTLFQFKAQFSDSHPPFYTGRWILNSAAYESLAYERRKEAERRGGHIGTHFPAYRAPILPAFQSA